MSNLFSIVRSAVSKDKVRFRDGEYDLDLTYITHRLIAMGFPASGMEATYRNDIAHVSEMLNSRHAEHYMLWNLSERQYDYALFNNMIMEFGWKDHHAPPLHILFKVVISIDSWLKADPKNVAVIHCMAGKGRTGTVIAAYLIFSGAPEFQDPVAALRFFGRKRSFIDLGVEQPSQIRYVRYFSEVLRGSNPNPNKLILRRITLKPVPAFSNNSRSGCRPLIQIFNTTESPETLIFSSAWTAQANKHYIPAEEEITIPLKLVCQGDITIRAFHMSSRFGSIVKSVPMFRCGFHTAFVGPRDTLTIHKKGLDLAYKDNRFSPDFVLELQFAPESKSGEEEKVESKQADKEVGTDREAKEPDDRTREGREQIEQEVDKGIEDKEDSDPNWSEAAHQNFLQVARENRESVLAYIRSLQEAKKGDSSPSSPTRSHSNGRLTTRLPPTGSTLVVKETRSNSLPYPSGQTPLSVSPRRASNASALGADSAMPFVDTTTKTTTPVATNAVTTIQKSHSAQELLSPVRQQQKENEEKEKQLQQQREDQKDKTANVTVVVSQQPQQSQQQGKKTEVEDESLWDDMENSVDDILKEILDEERRSSASKDDLLKYSSSSSPTSSSSSPSFSTPSSRTSSSGVEHLRPVWEEGRSIGRTQRSLSSSNGRDPSADGKAKYVMADRKDLIVSGGWSSDEEDLLEDTILRAVQNYEKKKCRTNEEGGEKEQKEGQKEKEEHPKEHEEQEEEEGDPILRKKEQESAEQHHHQQQQQGERGGGQLDQAAE